MSRTLRPVYYQNPPAFKITQHFFTFSLFTNLFYIFFELFKSFFLVIFHYYCYPWPLPSFGKRFLNLTGWILISGGLWSRVDFERVPSFTNGLLNNLSFVSIRRKAENIVENSSDKVLIENILNVFCTCSIHTSYSCQILRLGLLKL